MIRSSTYESHYSTGRLRDGSPVVVVQIRRAAEAERIGHFGQLPSSQEPMVVVYPQPTPGQSWQVIKKGCVMLWQCLRSAGGQYLRRCNLAYAGLAGIRINHKADK